jgi:hypothetical protein
LIWITFGLAWVSSRIDSAARSEREQRDESRERGVRSPAKSIEAAAVLVTRTPQPATRVLRVERVVGTRGG